MEDRIYISIASREDPRLYETIDSALKNAKYPERLVFGLALQYKNIPNLEHLKINKRVVILDSQTLFGVSKARELIIKMIGSEKYYLQIDAHTKFLPDWDEDLINDYELLKSRVDNQKIIFSNLTSTKIGTSPDGGEASYEDICINRTIGAIKTHKPKFKNKEVDIKNVYGVWMTKSEKTTSEPFEISNAINCGFLFSESRLWLEIDYPFYIKFHGEQVILSAYAFCSGWDVYAPDKYYLVQSPPSDYIELVVDRDKFLYQSESPDKSLYLSKNEYLDTYSILKFGRNSYADLTNKPRKVESFCVFHGLV